MFHSKSKISRNGSKVKPVPFYLLDERRHLFLVSISLLHSFTILFQKVVQCLFWSIEVRSCGIKGASHSWVIKRDNLFVLDFRYYQVRVNCENWAVSLPFIPFLI